MMDQAAWAQRVRAQMDYEWQREGPPEGFPALPPIPTGRYTDPDFYVLEQKHLWIHSKNRGQRYKFLFPSRELIGYSVLEARQIKPYQCL